VWRRLLITLVIGASASAAAWAEEPASSREASDPGAEAETRRTIDRDAAAALLPGLFDRDAARSATEEDGELMISELAAAVAAYAGCEIVADAILSELERAAAGPSPSAATEEPR
jgi:hypothetical protein